MCFLVSLIDPLLPIPKPAWYFEGVQTENNISCVASVERITNDIGFSRTLAIHSSRQQLDTLVTKIAAPYVQFLALYASTSDCFTVRTE